MSDNTYSEVLELYAQEALEQGLISEAEEETNPRYDSHDMKAVEILYGVQPNGDDDDILDKAHPDPVIIAPAYDRINALVENLKERQNVMVDIATKPNDGKHTQERYVKAQQDLFTAIKRATLLLERKNEDVKLIRLADSCSEEIVKKSAIITGTVVAVTALIAALVGTVGAAQRISTDSGTMLASELAIEKLKDLMEGGEYDDFDDLLESISALKDAAEYVENLKIADLRASKEESKQNPGKALVEAEAATKSLKEQKALKILEYHDLVASVLYKEIPNYIKLLKGKDEPEETWGYLREVGRWLHRPDLPDAIAALEDLMGSIRSSMAKTKRRSRLISEFAGKEDLLINEINEIKKQFEDEGFIEPKKEMVEEAAHLDKITKKALPVPGLGWSWPGQPLSLIQSIFTYTAVWSDVEAVVEITIEKLTDLIEDGEGEFDGFSNLLESIVRLNQAVKKVKDINIAELSVSEEDMALNPKETISKVKGSVEQLEEQKAFATLKYCDEAIRILTSRRGLRKYIGLLEDKENEKGGATGVGQWLLKRVYLTDVPDAIHALKKLNKVLLGYNRTIGEKRKLISQFAEKGSMLDEINKAEKELEEVEALSPPEENLPPGTNSLLPPEPTPNIG